MIVVEVTRSDEVKEYWVGEDETTVVSFSDAQFALHRQISEEEIEMLNVRESLDRKVGEILRKESKIALLCVQ